MKVSGDDCSVVEGVKNRLLETLSGTRFLWPGMRLRRPGISPLGRLRSFAGALVVVTVTVAVTVTVTILVTNLLS